MGLNPGFLLGWIVLLQFIFTLVFSIQCYPLQPGGLIAFQALLLGLTDAYHVLHEIETNLEVILLLVFMVSAIFFMKNLLMVIFTKLLQSIKSKILLSLLFVISAAFLSAFLDALTVTAVLITVMVGFYHVFANSLKNNEITTKEFEQVKSFLVDIMMHGAVGTALGGVCTIVGEPQNLLIADKAGWEFMEFFYRMAPVTMPVLVAGLICCVLIEKFKVFDYGHQMSDDLRNKIITNAEKVDTNRTEMEKLHLIMEGILGLCLIFALGLHLAPVGIIGLFLMAILLMIQLNSFYQVWIVISAVFLSTAGVYLGHLITQYPISFLFTNLGIIALAGIVVNNNIVLVDTYNVLKRENPGVSSKNLIVRTAAQRIRPIILTTATTVVGLMPLAMGLGVDLIARDIGVGGRVVEWWSPLSFAVVWGLTFASLMTLSLTPCWLMLPTKIKELYAELNSVKSQPKLNN